MDEKSRKAASEGVKEREIKQVRDADIVAAAYEQGRLIADASQQTLVSKLHSALGEGGVSGAVPFCNVAAYPLMDSLSQHYQAEIRRVSMRVRNPADKPSPIEAQILEAYQYSINNNQEIGENVQEVADDQLLYSKPILIANPLCLQCHGKEGLELEPAHNQLIKELYPADSATGYEMGQLRGMWSIMLSKKAIVNSL